jgi:hypothetical protein
MKLSRHGLALLLASAIGVGSLAFVAPPAGASEPPPVVVRNPRPLIHLAPGQTFTFKASAEDAVLAIWQVSSDGGSSWGFVSGGTTSTSKKGILNTSYVFGPFAANESGWEVRAGFVNDPTGVPSGIQTSVTTSGEIAHKTLKG